MVTTFISQAGYISTVYLRDQRTVTTSRLPEVHAPKNNASLHTDCKTIEFLRYMDNPSLNPDLSVNYFLIFPKINNGLRGQRLQSREEETKVVDEDCCIF